MTRRHCDFCGPGGACCRQGWATDIYAAFDDAGELGPSGLDAGTPYGGCKVDTTGRKIPEYDVSMSKVVDQAECNTYCTDNSLGACTYFGRTSADAIPAKAAHTGAVCGGYEADSCVAKYHKFTGKPIWATTTVNLRSMQPTAEGVVGLGLRPRPIHQRLRQNFTLQHAGGQRHRHRCVRPGTLRPYN